MTRSAAVVTFGARLRGVPFTERDAWVDAQLGFPAVPADIPHLPSGCVPYLPCGVEAILAMVHEAPVSAEDTFVDIGSGVGRVAVLAHLLTGARAHGIEIQAPLVAAAVERAAALDLRAVTFAHANAADVVLDGSRFFLYAPCNGSMLAGVLGRLREVARRRPIVVGAVDFELHDAAWLTPRTSSCRALTLYASA